MLFYALTYLISENLYKKNYTSSYSKVNHYDQSNISRTKNFKFIRPNFPWQQHSLISIKVPAKKVSDNKIKRFELTVLFDFEFEEKKNYRKKAKNSRDKSFDIRGLFINQITETL